MVKKNYNRRHLNSKLQVQFPLVGVQGFKLESEYIILKQVPVVEFQKCLEYFEDYY